jgi:hypothetical protein
VTIITHAYLPTMTNDSSGLKAFSGQLDLRKDRGAQIYQLISDSNYATPPYDQLYAIIAECLSQGDTQAVATATQLALQKNDNQSVRELKDLSEWAASCLVQPLNPRRTRTQLFAIPLATATVGALDPAAGALSDEVCAGLAQLMHSCLLAPAETAIHLAPYLYHPTELQDLDYHQVFNLTHALQNNESAHHPALAQRGWPPQEASSTDTRTQLRYLVGVAVMPVTAPYFLEHPSALNEYELEQRLEGWVRSAERLMLAGWNASSVLLSLAVGGPAYFYPALDEGRVLFADMTLEAALVAALVSQALHPRGAQVVLTTHGRGACIEKLQVSVASLLEHDLVACISRPLFSGERHHEVSAKVQQLLYRLGFNNVSVIAAIQQNAPDSDADRLRKLKDVSTPKNAFQPGTSPLLH